MNSILLGGIGTGKTTFLKDMISRSEQRVVVLDFNNQYTGCVDHEIFLDKLNPVLGEISLRDAMAINAGYLKSSFCLYRKCEEILIESGLSKKEYLIEEAVERLHISWDNAENMYGKILSNKIPLKRNRTHFSIEDVLEEAKGYRTVAIKSKNMHSDHMRACAFLFLSRLSCSSEESVTVVIDEVSAMYNSGNLKLFLKTLNPFSVEMFMSFNKWSSIPKDLHTFADRYEFFKVTNSNEWKQLLQFADRTGMEIPDLRKLRIGQSVPCDKKTIEI